MRTVLIIYTDASLFFFAICTILQIAGEKTATIPISMMKLIPTNAVIKNKKGLIVPACS